MKFLGKYESDDPRWHELRKNSLGGSQVGAILGLNPWESAVTCFYKVTGQISSDITETENMRLGKLLEYPLVQNFAVRHPEFKVDYNPGTFAHDDYEHFHANPDAFIEMEGQVGILEIKYSADFWDDVPAHYVAQVNWYMWITGAKFAYVAGLIGGRFREFHIQRNEFEIEAQVDAALRFWERVVKLERPDWDGSDSTYQTARQLNRDVVEGEVELGETGLWLLETTAMLAEATDANNEAKSKVLAMLGENKNGLVDGKKICYRQKASNGTPFLKVL